MSSGGGAGGGTVVKHMAKEASRWRKDRLTKLQTGAHVAHLKTGRMQYEIVGGHRWHKKFPTLLVLHGACGGIDQADAIARAQNLADDFNVIIVSRPGYLGTDIALGCLAVAEAVSMLALLDYLDVANPVSIQGFGPGAITALFMAALAPRRIERLVLVSIGCSSAPPTTATTASPLWDLTRLVIPPPVQEDTTETRLREEELTRQVQDLAQRMASGQWPSAASARKREEVQQQLVEITHRVTRNKVLCSFLDILSVDAFRRVQQRPGEVFAVLASVDSHRATDEMRSANILEAKQRTELLQAFVTSMTPLRDRLEGLVADMFNVSAFWPAALDASSPVAFPWEQVTVPTLIVQSPDDIIGSMQHAESVCERLPNAHMLRVPNAGHYVWLSPFVKVWRKEVARFLQGKMTLLEQQQRQLSLMPQQQQQHHQPQSDILLVPTNGRRHDTTRAAPDEDGFDDDNDAYDHVI